MSVLVAYLSIAPVLNLVSGPASDELLVRSVDLLNTMVHSAQLKRTRRIVFEGTDDLFSPAIPNEGVPFKAKPGNPTGVRLSFAPYQPRIDCKSGSRPWPRQRNIPGRSILFGNSCTTIPGPYRSWPAIHFQTHRPFYSCATLSLPIRPAW